MESENNRCAIVVIWNEAGSLPAYMKFYVEKLLEVCSRVIVHRFKNEVQLMGRRSKANSEV